MRLIIKQDRDLIADLPFYDGPIPRVGEYIFHPPFKANPDTDWSDDTVNIAGCVSTVTYGIYARPQNGETHFVNTQHPFVEITI